MAQDLAGLGYIAKWQYLDKFKLTSLTVDEHMLTDLTDH